MGNLRSQRGFSLIEMLLTLFLLSMMASIFMATLFSALSSVERESNRALSTSTGRAGMEMLTQTLRNDVLQINSQPGTPQGVNFDLDDGGNPLVRDGVLFYVDEDNTGLLYSSDESGQAISAGFDDNDGDGNADLVGIGLMPQLYNGDRVFIDVNGDGIADDLDGDGRIDPLWILVLQRFNNIDEVSEPGLWKSGIVLARDIFLKLTNPTGDLAGGNIETIQFKGRNATAMASDTNKDGYVDESELGNLKSKDGIINDPEEIANIDTIQFSLHVARKTEGVQDRSRVMTRMLTTEVAPRPIVMLRRNGIIGALDPTLAKNIDQHAQGVSQP